MTQSRNSFVLILLLALLQCFAPLLHAHAHGQSGVSGVHLHAGIEWQLAGYSSSTTNLIAERVDAPVIAMVQEYRQDSAMLLSDADQPGPTASPSTASFSSPSVLAIAAAGIFPDTSPLYLRPFSQAPPPALS